MLLAKQELPVVIITLNIWEAIYRRQEEKYWLHMKIIKRIFHLVHEASSASKVGDSVFIASIGKASVSVTSIIEILCLRHSPLSKTTCCLSLPITAAQGCTAD